ncbi:MAG: ComF family protein, partial [Shewanella sp.]
MPHVVKRIWSQSALRIMRLGYQLGATWLAGSLPNRCLLCHQSIS